MTTYLICKTCGNKFAVSTVEYMAIGAVCPNCGVKDEKRIDYCSREGKSNEE